MLEFHTLRLAERLDLASSDRSPGGRPALHLAYAARRGARLALPSGWLSLWLPLRGELQLESAHCRWTLQGQLLIAREGPLHGGSNADAVWLVLSGPHAAWKTFFAHVPGGMQCADLLPRQWPCPRQVRRPMMRNGLAASRRRRDFSCSRKLLSLSAIRDVVRLKRWECVWRRAMPRRSR